MEPSVDVEFKEKLKKIKPNNEYVCFIDVMGTKQLLSRDLKRATDFMLRLHQIILKTKQENHYDVNIYPVMDGAYITTPKQPVMLNFLTTVYNTFMRYELKIDDYHNWFLIRSAIAYGQIIHGKTFPTTILTQRIEREGYVNNFVTGWPVALAYEGESKAAPMGIYLDNTAVYRIDGIQHDWKWYTHYNISVDGRDNSINHMKFRDYVIQLEGYYKWLDHHLDYTHGYDCRKRAEHLRQIKDYYMEA